MCLPCVDGHIFSHSMITHKPFMRFDGFLNSLSCGLGRVRGYISRASLLVHDFVLVMLLLVLLMSLRASRRFVLIITRSFLRAYISCHAFYGDSMASFMNQILHLANPHDKLSTFVLYPRLGFPSIHRLTLWYLRLGHFSLSCHM
jgi:hypothetical protein